MKNDICLYNESQKIEYRDICEKLLELISKELSKAESKVWHGNPVWFIDGNPIVGYSVLKAGVQLLFWSGQSFDEIGLKAIGKSKAAGIYYSDINDLKSSDIDNWLKKAKQIQWDYKNIVKNKGKLTKIGQW